MIKIRVVGILLILSMLLLLPSCASQVSQEEYNALGYDLSAAESQIETLQRQLTEAETLHNELSANYDSQNRELQALQGEYDQLSAQYNQLNAEYNVLLGNGENITAEDVEGAIFKLINQERENNGLDKLVWGDNLYKWAINHSRYMATENRFQYSEYTTWQDIFWAAGYPTVDKVAEAAMIIWGESRQYERNFINSAATYGAVAVVKQGEIFYITYFAHYEK